MKIFLLPVLVLFMAAGSAQAYIHSVKNASKVRIHFSAAYVLCRGNSFTVPAGATLPWATGLCCLKSVSIWIKDKTKTTTAGANERLHCGNTNWAVDGSENGDSLSVKRI
jgi:hypothetical protein